MTFRLHGNIESMALLSDGTENTRDSITLAFKDAKIACLEFDDSINGLRTRYAHVTLDCHFERPTNIEYFFFAVDGHNNLTFN
jgi:hypothetical protein